MGQLQDDRSSVLDIVRAFMQTPGAVLYGFGGGARSDGAEGDEVVLTISIRRDPHVGLYGQALDA